MKHRARHLASVFCLLLGALAQLGCPDARQQEGKKKQEEPRQCTASVVFEEIIVTQDTDPAPINDRWTIEAQVLPQFPPNPGNFTTIVNGVAADQGGRLIGPQGGQPFTFGPKILGPKDQRYDLHVLIKSKESDPAQENRGQDDAAPFMQQFEIRNILCPNDAQARYKFKDAVVDPQNGAERGQLEFTLRIDLDP